MNFLQCKVYFELVSVPDESDGTSRDSCRDLEKFSGKQCVDRHVDRVEPSFSGSLRDPFFFAPFR